MLQPMFDTVQPDQVFGGGYGERMFRSLQVEQFAKSMTHAGGIGLADAIAREMLRLQEKANG
jgi:Rod binding domain-containing protein